MCYRGKRTIIVLLAIAGCTSNGSAQQVLSWQQVRDKFLAANPTLQASQLSIQESKANEITAGLRPNPQLSFTTDQYQFFPSGGDPFRPLSSAQMIPVISELWERKHKRQFRMESARLATTGTEADTADLQRNLFFSLRDSFNRILQAKSLLELAQENLTYYDRVISLNRERFNAGDISKVDFQRVELQRVQFESDLANAEVNLRTAKIQIIALLNDRTPLDRFDVSGNFDSSEGILLDSELRQMALDSRPDLKSAGTAIERARVENKLAFANELDLFYGADLRRKLPLLALFEVVVDATHTGILKPDPRAYALVTQQLGLTPADCVFVDDQLRNIHGAQSAGMQVVHFDVMRPQVSYDRALRLLGLPPTH